MENEEFSFLKQNRGYLRGKVTKKHAAIDEVDDYDIQKCNDELCIIKGLQVKLNELNNSISRGLWIHVKEEKAREQEVLTIDQYDEYINKLISRLELRLKQVLDSQSSTQQSFSGRIPEQEPIVPGGQGHLRLPQVPLPEYTHREGENLAVFFRNFEDVVQKFNLSQYEKFILLESKLKNEPATLIKSLQGSNRSYNEAKALLIQAFASVTTQSYNIIDKMASLHLKEGDDPYQFISEVRIIRDTFQTLNIDINTVLQFFIWRGMPEALRSEFIHITNNCKPNLRQIEDSILKQLNVTLVDALIGNLTNMKLHLKKRLLA